MSLAATDYGPLKDVVATAGAIIAAAGAIGLSWRGRKGWEPSEEDLPAGGRRVGVLLAGVAIALMWAEWRGAVHVAALDATAIILAAVTVISLLAYAYLVGNQTYVVLDDIGARSRVIGGFWLTDEALSGKRHHHVTTQELLEGAAYNVEWLWSRPSRQVAKMCFVICYLLLTVCGTVALAAAAIRLGLAVG